MSWFSPVVVEVPVGKSSSGLAWSVVWRTVLRKVVCVVVKAWWNEKRSVKK